MLPSPPNEREKLAYIHQNKWLIYSWGLVSFAGLLIGMSLFTAISPFTYGFAPIVALTGIYLGLSYFIGLLGRPWNQNRHEIRKNYWKWRHLFKDKPEPLPQIDVYLPSCGEPIEVLNNTFYWTRQLIWEEGKLHVYVLDDSGRREVAQLSDKYEFNYIARPERGVMKKAGNIRHAFTRTTGDFILILDADFAPRPDMLTEMMPYFDDEKCAIVQSPQYFSIEDGMTWVMKGAAYIQELFYRMIQVHRDTWRAAICVGTCALYRRRALEPHGGTYAIEYSEDMMTGWQATVDGWHVKYLPINLSKGLCPESMSAFFVQQTRWCTGSTGLLFSKAFWTKRLTIMQRLCYLSGQLYYIATSIALIAGPIPSAVVVWFFPSHVFWYNFLWAFPSFLMGVVVMNVWSRAPWGIHVLSARQVSYYAHCFALWNRFRGTILEWIPSGNDGQTRKAGDYKKFKKTMFYWTSITTIIGIGGGFYRMDSLYDFNFYPIIFFSAVNHLVCSLCFVEEA